MRNIVNEDGEIIAKATKDGTLVGGHHRILMAGSLYQKLFWQDTGEPVKLDALMHPSSHRYALAALANGLLLLVLRGRCTVLAPFDIALGCAHAGGVHRTIWLGAVRRSRLLHAGLRSRAGVLGKGRAAQER